MTTILRRPAAEDDLVAIWVHIAIDDTGAADRLLDRIEDVLALLAANPYLGRERPELGSATRSFTVGRYVLFYAPLEGGIDLVRVMHGARDIETKGFA